MSSMCDKVVTCHGDGNFLFLRPSSSSCFSCPSVLSLIWQGEREPFAGVANPSSSPKGARSMSYDTLLKGRVPTSTQFSTRVTATRHSLVGSCLYLNIHLLQELSTPPPSSIRHPRRLTLYEASRNQMLRSCRKLQDMLWQHICAARGQPHSSYVLVAASNQVCMPCSRDEKVAAYPLGTCSYYFSF